MGVGGFNEKRTLEELAFAYEVEPELRDIYVEGRTDRVFLEHLLSDPNVRVWEDGDIDVPGDLVREHGFGVGCKGRVAALAVELEKRLGGVDLRVRCIVDADCDRIMGTTLLNSKYLRYTDFTCVESYFWDEFHVEKYLKLGLHDTLGFDSQAFLAALNPILIEIFLLRVAHQEMGRGWKWVSVASCITAKRGSLSFDREKQIRKYLQSNSAWGQRDEFEQVIERYRQRLEQDVRHCLHGHDLTEVVAEVVKECVKPKTLGQAEIVARMLAMTIERKDARAFPLLRELEDTMCTG